MTRDEFCESALHVLQRIQRGEVTVEWIAGDFSVMNGHDMRPVGFFASLSSVNFFMRQFSSTIQVMAILLEGSLGKMFCQREMSGMAVIRMFFPSWKTPWKC